MNKQNESERELEEKEEKSLGGETLTPQGQPNEQTGQAAELKPCAHCGAKVVLRDRPGVGVTREYSIECSTPGCFNWSTVSSKHKAELIKLWNRRVPPETGPSGRRIVLGHGYPWAMGTGPYFEVALRHAPVGGINLPLDFPNDLWKKTVGKYRLVLEAVDVKRRNCLTKNEYRNTPSLE